MKTTRKVLFILVIILIFSSCFSPWKRDEGTFSINVGGSGNGRTALPWDKDSGIRIEDLVHEITLKGPGLKQTVSITGAKTVSFSVVPGLWNITIEANEVRWEDDEEHRFLVAFGYRTVDIKPGFNGAINIPMSLMEMVWVAGGTFELGKGLGTVANNPNEDPVSNVTLTGFYIGKYEVTQAQWEAVMKTTIQQQNSKSSNPGLYGVGDNYPMYQVSWYDILEFCNNLSVKEGLTPAYRINDSTDPAVWGPQGTGWDAVTIDSSSTGYRLPTEAQWEYAAKGGNPLAPGWVGYTYAGSDNVDDVAWYEGNSNSSGTKPVGKDKAPNGLGIYDMSGNVWERCWDWYKDYTSADKTDPTGPENGSYRVGRGGGYRLSVTKWELKEEVRSVYRHDYIGPSYRYDDLGFRVARPR